MIMNERVIFKDINLICNNNEQLFKDTLCTN